MRRGVPIFPQLLSIAMLWCALHTALAGKLAAQVVVDTTRSDTSRNDTSRTDSTAKTDTLQAPTSNNSLEFPVHYQAQDSIRFDLSSQKIYLFNKAQVDYDKLELDAGNIVIDADSNLVYARGIEDTTGNARQQPVFKEGPDEYRAKRMVYNFKSEKGKIYEIATEEGEGLVYGENVKKNKDGTMYIQDARYTTCQADHPHFYIRANKIKVIPKDKIISGPAQLVMADVPLPLVVPFGFFPNSSEGASGIVIPKYGESNDRGFFLRDGGVFLRLGEHFNSLTQGDIYSKGSWRVNQVFRYKKRYGFEGNFDFQFARNQFGDPESANFRDERSYFVKWNHRQSRKARPGVTFNANVNFGSSSFLQTNSYNNSDIVRNNLSSSVSYSKNWMGTPFNLNTSLRHNQSIANETMTLELPKLVLSMQRINPFERKQRVGDKKWYENIGYNASLNMINNGSGPEDRLFDADTSRFLWSNGASVNHQVSTNFKVLRYFTLSPSFSARNYLYTKRRFLTYQQERDSITRRIETGFYDAHSYNFNASMNTRIYGMFNINRFGIQAIRHVITPTVSMSYQPDFARTGYGGYEPVGNVEAAENRETALSRQALQAYSIFYNPQLGRPGQGERGSLNFSIQNNLEMKFNQKTDTGMTEKKVTLVDAFNLSGNYNFLADSQQLSAVSMNFRTRIAEKYDIQASATVNPYVLSPDSSGRTVDTYLWNTDRKPGRITNFTANFGTNYQAVKNPEAADRYNNPYYRRFRTPWNFGVRYQLRYTKPAYTPTLSHQANFNARLELTENWRLQGTSGYDFTNEQVSFTSVNITRDLHCWQFDVRWIPFGRRRSYYFTLNVKASVLQDLKLDKRRDFFDFTER